MRNRRTDLALEARQLRQQEGGENHQIPGVEVDEHLREGYTVTCVRVLDERGEGALDRPRGSYITLELDPLNRREEDAFGRGVRAVAAELSTLLPSGVENKPVLVVGLGNRGITPDALGPTVHRHILITRHLVEGGHFEGFTGVAALAAGVLGTTGMESGELVESVCRRLEPGCVIAVDALASRSVHRLCRTVQLTDTGIAPGSGVGSHRRALTARTLGVPVIGVGVPTVVDAATLAADLMDVEEPPKLGRELFVTPKDIDARIRDLGKVIGYAVNLALQPGLGVEDLDMLLS